MAASQMEIKEKALSIAVAWDQPPKHQIYGIMALMMVFEDLLAKADLQLESFMEIYKTFKVDFESYTDDGIEH
jgi:hypothetical protein